MAKICLLIQRYGQGINGGAEVHAQQVAEQLSKYHDVDVVTTCAEEYTTWEPNLPAGQSVENGIQITRLNNQPRDQKQQQSAYNALKYSPSIFIRRKLFKHFNKPFLKPRDKVSPRERLWIESQGPYIPSLGDYLKQNTNTYDVFIFFTSVYYIIGVGVLF